MIDSNKTMSILCFVLLIINPILFSHQNASGESTPIPQVWVSDCPSVITIGEDVTITIKGSNSGGESREGDLCISFPSNPAYVKVVNTDIEYKIKKKSEMIWSGYGQEQIPAKYPLVCAFTKWGSGEQHYLTVKVKPEQPGNFNFYFKMTIQDNDSLQWFGDPNSGKIDQQNEYTHVYTIEVKSKPTPDPYPTIIGKPSYPSQITLGEYAEITINGINNGGDSSEAYLSVSFPSNPGSVSIRSTDASYSQVSRRGDTIWENYGQRKIDADYPIAEVWEAPWRSGLQRYLTVKVKPEQEGDFSFYVKMTAKDSDSESWLKDPSSGNRDQQNEYVYKYEIYVDLQERVTASIIDSKLATGEYKKGDSVTSGIRFKNSGNIKWTFYVGYDVQDKNGYLYNVQSHPVTLNAGETSGWEYKDWQVPSSPVNGPYNAVMTIWKTSPESDPSQEPLDEKLAYGSFTVKGETPAGKADLYVQKIELESAIGAPTEISELEGVALTIGNKGESDAINFFDCIYLRVISSSGTFYKHDIPSYEPTSLKRGESATRRFMYLNEIIKAWSFSTSLPSGKYEIELTYVVDCKYDVNEVDEKNNKASLGTFNFEIISTSNPSIQIELEIYGSGSPTPASLKAIYSVKNLGKETVNVMVQLNQDCPPCELISEKQVTLQAGEKKEFSEEFMEALTGEHTVTAAVYDLYGNILTSDLATYIVGPISPGNERLVIFIQSLDNPTVGELHIQNPDGSVQKIYVKKVKVKIIGYPSYDSMPFPSYRITTILPIPIDECIVGAIIPLTLKSMLQEGFIILAEKTIAAVVEVSVPITKIVLVVKILECIHGKEARVLIGSDWKSDEYQQFFFEIGKEAKLQGELEYFQPDTTMPIIETKEWRGIILESTDSIRLFIGEPRVTEEIVMDMLDAYFADETNPHTGNRIPTDDDIFDALDDYFSGKE